MLGSSGNYPLDDLEKYKNGLIKEVGIDGDQAIKDLNNAESVFAPVGSTYNVPPFQTLQDPIGVFVSVTLSNMFGFKPIFMYPKGAEGFKSVGVYNPEGLTGSDLVDKLMEFNENSSRFGSHLLKKLFNSISHQDKKEGLKLINSSSYLKMFEDPGDVLKRIAKVFNEADIKSSVVVRYGTPIMYEDSYVQINLPSVEQARVESGGIPPNYHFTKGKTSESVTSDLHISSALLDVIVTHYHNLYKIFREIDKEEYPEMKRWLKGIPLSYNIIKTTSVRNN